MKKRLGLLALTAVLTSVAYGASIDHIQTYTPEYLGNQAQNGMINNASVYYNPAGIVNLEKGTYVHVGAQLAVGHEKMEYKGEELKADLFQPIPNFAMYKVEDNSALYWTFGGIAGGGDLKYDNGVAGTAVVGDILYGLGEQLKKQPGLGGINPFANVDTNGSSAEGKNLYAQTTLGKVWKIDDKLSVSAAGRLVYGIRELSGEIKLNGIKDIPGVIKGNYASIDSERTAWGYGVQLGLNYQATEKLNLAMRYDSRVKMNFKAKTNGKEKTINIVGADLGFSTFYPEYADGTKSRRDLPAILAAGMSYKVTDNWTVGLSGNYYFNKDAKLDRIKSESTLGKLGVKEIKAEYDNGWELALGTEYRFSPKWAVLGSINYADTGAKVTSYDDVEYALNSVTLGTGLKYNPDETSEWVFTVCHFFYDSEDGHYNQKYSNPPFTKVGNPSYDKSITAFGVSYTKKF